MGIPDYWPTIGPAYYGSPVSVKGVPLAYSGWGPHQGQWSFDPQRSERLTPPPPGPSLVSRTLPQFPAFIVHSVLSIGSVRPPGFYLLKLNHAYPWASVDPMAVASTQTTCRFSGRGSISLPSPCFLHAGPHCTQHLDYFNTLLMLGLQFPSAYNHFRFPSFLSLRITRPTPNL